MFATANWFLVFTVWTGQGGYTQPVQQGPYFSQQACEEAGKVVKSYQPVIIFTCVPVPTEGD
jgi:hypothetical protein